MSDNEGTISVRGTGRLLTTPDQITVSICLRSEDLDYGTAVSAAEKRLKQIEEAAASAGFSHTDIKTADISVDCRYEYVRTEDGCQIREFRGYVYTRLLKIAFPSDMHRLADLLDALAACGASPELTVSFGLQDYDKAAVLLMAAAAEDAKMKAEALAQASGACLGRLRKIIYGSEDRSAGGGMLMNARAASAAVPEDIALTDSAVFVWELRQI